MEKRMRMTRISRERGETQKQMGLDLVEEHNPDFIQLMRNQAFLVARIHGQVCCDDLRAYAKMHNIKPKHPNAWGAVFRTGFRRIGYTPSAWPSCHARVIGVWENK
jgi:hypothetical protein